MTTIIILITIIIISLITIFLLNTGVNYLIKKKVSIEDKNKYLSTYVIKAVLFLVAGILINSLYDAFQKLVTVLSNSLSGNELFLQAISRLSIFWVITLLAIAFLGWLAFLLYILVSDGENLFIEIGKNNLRATILFCGLFLALAIGLHSGLVPILEQLIPYPTLPEYR